jgi:hypothetical protein
MANMEIERREGLKRLLGAAALAALAALPGAAAAQSRAETCAK